MLALVIYLAIAFFISSILLYMALDGDNSEANSDLGNGGRIALAFFVPSLWPLAIAIGIYTSISIYFNSRRAARARQIMSSINGDLERLKELSTRELKALISSYRQSERMENECSKAEQTLLDRVAEESLL